MQVIMGPAWLAGWHPLPYLWSLSPSLYFPPCFWLPNIKPWFDWITFKKVFFSSVVQYFIQKMLKGIRLEANCLSRVLSHKTLTRYVNTIKMGETHVKITDITHYCPNFFESPVLVFLKRCRHHWSRCWLWSKSWHWSRCWDVRTWTQHTTLCNICTWAPGMLHPSG